MEKRIEKEGFVLTLREDHDVLGILKERDFSKLEVDNHIVTLGCFSLTKEDKNDGDNIFVISFVDNNIIYFDIPGDPCHYEVSVDIKTVDQLFECARVNYIGHFGVNEEEIKTVVVEQAVERVRTFDGAITVNTPIGVITVCKKADPDYPGVCVTLLNTNGIEIDLVDIEYEQIKEVIQTVVYANAEKDEPTVIVEHTNAGKFKGES